MTDEAQVLRSDEARLVLAVVLNRISQGVYITLPYTLAVYIVRAFLAPDADEHSVGRYTGALAAAAAGAQCTTSFLLGFLSDRIGRKPVILAANIAACASVTALGLATEYRWAVASRLVGGLFTSGNGVAIKAMIGEYGDSTFQARALGWMVTGWGAGTVLGPAIGGLLANPCTAFGSGFPLCEPGQLFRRHPFLLPCECSASLAFLACLQNIFLMPSSSKRSGSSSSCSGHGRGSARTAYERLPTSHPADEVQGSAAAGGPVERSGDSLVLEVAPHSTANDDATAGDDATAYGSSGHEIRSSEQQMDRLPSVSPDGEVWLPGEALNSPSSSSVALEMSHSVTSRGNSLLSQGDSMAYQWLQSYEPSALPPLHLGSSFSERPVRSADSIVLELVKRQERQERQQKQVDQRWQQQEQTQTASTQQHWQQPQQATQQHHGAQQHHQRNQQKRFSEDTGKQDQQGQLMDAAAIVVDGTGSSGRSSASDDTTPSAVAATAGSGAEAPDPNNAWQSSSRAHVVKKSQLHVDSAADEAAGPDGADGADAGKTASSSRSSCEHVALLPPSQQRSSSSGIATATTQPQKSSSTSRSSDHHSQQYSTDSGIRVQGLAVPWYRQKPMVLALLGAGVVTGVLNAVDELTPMLASAAVVRGGLGMSEQQLAGPMSAGGLMLVMFSVAVFPALHKRWGSIGCVQFGLAGIVPASLLMPTAAAIGEYGSRAAALVIVYLALSLRSVMKTMVLSSSSLLINKVAVRDKLGAINGAAQTLQSLARALGPALAGAVWGVLFSISAFLPFGLVCMGAVTCMVLYAFMPVTPQT